MAPDGARHAESLQPDEADTMVGAGGLGAGGLWHEAMQGGRMESQDTAPAWLDNGHVWLATQMRVTALQPEHNATCCLTPAHSQARSAT